MSSPKAALTGIVLAGGGSTRMGRDKASLPWGREDLLHAVLRALIPACARLIVVSNTPRDIAVPEVAVVADIFQGCGPLGGLHAGLAAAVTEYSFVAACDMPFVNGAAVSYMASAAAGFDAAVPFVDGFFHPLHAVYHRRCLASVERALLAGQRRVSDFYPGLALRRISRAELSRFDPELLMLNSLNRPQDLPAKL